MKNNIVFLLLLMIAPSCREKKISDLVFIPFSNQVEISDINGNPRDSLTLFFPVKFNFLKIQFHNSSGKPIDFRNHSTSLDSWLKGEKQIKIILNDTSGIKDYLIKFQSFGLNKMKLPVLYNYYLNKDIYRLIIDRSFDPLLVIQIEKTKDDCIFANTYQLDRVVGYPFMIFKTMSTLDFVNSPNKERIEFEKKADSLAKKYNNPNYFSRIIARRKLSLSDWENLSYQIEKFKFWHSIPECQTYPKVDGSNWFLEGHNQYGYQIKTVRCPNQKKDSLSNLIRYFINMSGIEIQKERLY